MIEFVLVVAVLGFLILRRKPKYNVKSIEDKLRLAGRWAEVEFADEAIPLGTRNHVISLYNQGVPDLDSFPTMAPRGRMSYSKSRVYMLEAAGIPVLHVDTGKEIPDEYKPVNPISKAMDKFEIDRWFY